MRYRNGRATEQANREYAQGVRKGVERIGQALKVNDKIFIFYTPEEADADLLCLAAIN